ADLQQREQQVADTQRLQHAQQQMQDIQREEIQRKEQQVVGQQHQLQQQQQADMHLREQQVTEQQHQLQQQQQADMHLREQQVAEQHQLLQADMHLREKQVAEQQHQLQLQQQLNRLQQQLEAQSGAELQRQVQQQLAVQQHLLQQQQADLLLKQQHVEKQLQEAAVQQAVSTNHSLLDHPTCSPLVPGSLRSPLFKRPRQDTTQAPMPRHHSVAHALRIPGLPYSAVVSGGMKRVQRGFHIPFLGHISLEEITREEPQFLLGHAELFTDHSGSSLSRHLACSVMLHARKPDGSRLNVVVDADVQASTCGYCKSDADTSVSHGTMLRSGSAVLHQPLFPCPALPCLSLPHPLTLSTTCRHGVPGNDGSGLPRTHPTLQSPPAPDCTATCCPPYTIRMHANQFQVDKKQRQLQRKWQRFLAVQELVHQGRLPQAPGQVHGCAQGRQPPDAEYPAARLLPSKTKLKKSTIPPPILWPLTSKFSEGDETRVNGSVTIDGIGMEQGASCHSSVTHQGPGARSEMACTSVTKG
ncbi:reticulocyte-binding protein 2 homolog a, partial [Haematococcus lacustris]